MSEEDEIAFFKTKILAIQNLSDEAIKKGVKSIVNISSVYAISPNFKSRLASVLQQGVTTLTKIYAKAYVGKTQINSVAPGWVNTDMVKLNYDKDVLKKVIHEKLPIKRLIEPEEVARVVSFIIKNPLITGQTFIVDGGYHLLN